MTRPFTASVEEPRQSFDGLEYFINGQRLVIFLSEETIGLDDGGTVYDWWNASGVEENRLFQGERVAAPNNRLYAQEEGDLKVTTAVSSAKETEKVLGIDLYAKTIQPVWVQMENHGDV
jgi:hypothetical protein